MPILVQWKWTEQTSSFLVVFHFFDNFSEPNLRMGKLEDRDDVKINAILTWAPSHVELGLLSDILRYANIIDGLNEKAKRKLREKLEMVREQNTEQLYGLCTDTLREILTEASPKERGYVHVTKVKDPKSSGVHLETAILLCPEYIEYVKKALKPYLQT